MGNGSSSEKLSPTEREKTKSKSQQIIEEGMKRYNVGLGKEVPVEELRKHVENLKIKGPDDKNGFQFLFQLVEGYSPKLAEKLEFTVATSYENKNLNRYTNVLPPDHSRVKLSLDAHNENDYINASFVNGIIKGAEKAYICTQGPNEDTIESFWRMVFDQKVAVVVMLTKEIENNKVKCAKYWPDKGEKMQLAAHTVKVTEENESQNLVIRKIVLHRGDKSRKVVQIQYTGWPDYGLPEDIGTFLDIVEMADKENNEGSPLVVHCSAGIGRSGTFCVVHTNMEMMRKSKKQSKRPPLNILETILHFRKQRPGMVQTIEQAEFCYHALLEAAEKRLKYKMKD